MKKEILNLILVDVGDCLYGFLIVNMDRGKSVIELIKCVGYDYIIFGNYDFNYGKDRLFELFKSVNLGENILKFLLLNIFENGKKVFDSNDIKEIDGIKIGFFGFLI